MRFLLRRVWLAALLAAATVALHIGRHEVNVSRLHDFAYRAQLIYGTEPPPPAARLRAVPDLYNFSLASGYVSDGFAAVSDAYESVKDSRIVYLCTPDDFRQLTAVHIAGATQRATFSARRLLATLRHRQLAFVGDSLARQFFLDVAAELRPWQTQLQFGAPPTVRALDTRRNGNGSAFGGAEAAVETAAKDVFMRRLYADFNASLLWCQDPHLAAFSRVDFNATRGAAPSGARPSHCDWAALTESDAVVVGVGAWFKPLFETSPDRDYYADLDLKLRSLRAATAHYRTLLRRHSRRGAAVLWALLPHVGLIDELQYRSGALHSHRDRPADGLWAPHDDGRHWSNATRAALFPAALNQALRHTAQQFRDDVIDVWRVSALYLQRFAGSGVAVHVDSLHWSPGGVFRGAAALLQTALAHRLGAAAP